MLYVPWTFETKVALNPRFCLVKSVTIFINTFLVLIVMENGLSFPQ